MQTVSRLPLTDEGFAAFLALRDEPDWVTAARRAAWHSFGQQSWPSQRDEEWMRTDIRLFHLDQFEVETERAAADEALPEALLSQGVELAGALSTFNGATVESRVDERLAAQGVIFGALDALLHPHSARLADLLMRAAFDPHVDRFAALHAAWWTGGNLLWVPRGVTVERPLHVLTGVGADGVDFGHALVVLEDDAEATLLVETASATGDARGLHCGATEIVLGRGARLRLVSLQNWGRGVWHFAHQKAVVGPDASLQWTIGALGGRLAKVNQHVALAGAGASCQVNGVMFTEGKQHLSYNTLQHHQQPFGTSDFLYKAALQDQSRTVWRGMIKVDPRAQRTDGYQRNDNLLLSDRARADSIPGLEIEADDVRCTHGSTSGRVDGELIFYCRSRGFTRQEAVRAVVAGFFQQVFDRITIPSVREALGAAIGRRVRAYQ